MDDSETMQFIEQFANSRDHDLNELMTPYSNHVLSHLEQPKINETEIKIR